MIDTYEGGQDPEVARLAHWVDRLERITAQLELQLARIPNLLEGGDDDGADRGVDH